MMYAESPIEGGKKRKSTTRKTARKSTTTRKSTTRKTARKTKSKSKK